MRIESYEYKRRCVVIKLANAGWTHGVFLRLLAKYRSQEVDELLQQLTALDAKLDALLANDTLTDEQKVEHDKLVKDRETLLSKIATKRSVLARETERKQLSQEFAAIKLPARGRITDPDLPAFVQAPTSGRFILPAQVKRYGSLRHFTGVVDGRSPEERAYRFGTTMLAFASLQMPGRYRFESAIDWYQKNMAAVGSNDASGYQYLVPEEFGQDLIDLRERRGVVRKLFKLVPMSSDTRTDPRRKGGLTAYFVGQNAAGTESNKTWDPVRLTAKDLMALARYSNQLREDAVLNIGDDLAGDIAYAFADKEDKCGFNGDGTSEYGGITGARTALASSGSAGLVTQGTSNTWAALVLSDFDKVVGKLPEYADTPETSWVCHRTFYYEVVEKLIQASGGVPAYEVRAGERSTPRFKGYPVLFSQVFPNTTAVATIPILLGNFVLGASFGDRRRDEIAFSEHASIGGENLFERNQIGIRGTERFDVVVHDVGDSTNPGPIVGLKTGA